MNAQKIIDDLKKEGYDLQQIKDALCDGAWLAEAGYTDEDQEVIEEAYDLIKKEIAYK